MGSVHTPGPWSVEKGEGDGEGKLIVASENDCICFMTRSDYTTPSNEHENARLIAAAPELLGAAEAVADRLNGGIEPWAQELAGKLYAAIAKATGSSHEKLPA